MFLALFASTSVIQVVQAETSRRTPATPARSTTRTRCSAARSSPAAPRSRARCRPTTCSAGSGSTPTPTMWAPVTGYINPALGAATGIEQAMNQELSGTAGSQFLVAHRADLHRPAAARVERRADAGCRRAARRLRRAGRPRRARSSRSSPSTGRVLAMVTEPELRHEPARRRTTRTRSTPYYDAARRRSGASAVQPRDRRRPEPARLDVQARRRLGRARLGRVHAGVDPAQPRLVPAAAVEQHRLQRQRRHVRSRRHGDDRRRAAAELQHPVRRARGRARRHGDPRRGREVRLQRVVRAAARLDAVELPPRPRRPADRAHRLRAGAGDGHAAADGDGLGRHRERRNRHEPAGWWTG